LSALSKKRESEQFQQAAAIKCSEEQVDKREDESVEPIQAIEETTRIDKSDPKEVPWPSLGNQEFVEVKLY